jgi:arylsulfatase A-like enzyme/Flp pilus assembly protein TadD
MKPMDLGTGRKMDFKNKNEKKRKKILLSFILISPVFSICSFYLFCKSPVKKNHDANVLIITLDTTRADRIGVYGYEPARTPNIDAIAREGVRFENAYTPVPLTLPSHCSLFTGTIPLYHTVRNNGRYRLPEQADTLAEILKRRGFVTAAFVSSFTVDSRFGLDQGFDTYNDNLPVKKGLVKTYHSERPAALVFEDFACWFKTHSSKNKNKTFFAWVHFFDPHLPYSPPEPFKSRFQKNPYDGEIAYMDVYVGKIIDLLKEKQMLQNTLIIIAGDHGEAFGEHGEFGHMMFCYEENLKVPFIFYCQNRLPGNRKIVSRVNLTDILPTILDFLEIKIPSHRHLEGASLLPLIEGEKIGVGERFFYIESLFPKESLGCAPVKGLIKGDYKFIDLPKPELYDLEKDPCERENLFLEQNATAKKLKHTLSRFIKQYDSLALRFRSGRTLSLEEERKLKSLGYFSAPQKRSKVGRLPDPKDKVDSLTEFIKGNRSRGEGNIDAALLHFHRAIEMNPTFSWPYSTLALVYFENGKIEDAIQVLKKGMADNPDDYQLKIDYSMLLKKQSRFDEAIKILCALNMQGPVDSGAEINYLLGDLYTKKGDIGNAILSFQRSLDTEPENLVIKKKLVYLLHQSKRFSEALEIYRDLENITPNDTGLLFNMAVLYDQLGKYILSRSYYKKLIGKKPPVRVYFSYAVLLAKTGDLKEAVKQMRRFINNYSPDDALKKSARQYLKKWKVPKKAD